MGEFFSAFGGGVAEVVLPVVAATVGGMLVRLIHKLTKKAGVELTAEQQAAIEKKIIEAILRTEEVARRTVMNHEQKRQMTLTQAQAELPGMPLSEIRERVDRALPIARVMLTGSNDKSSDSPLEQ